MTIKAPSTADRPAIAVEIDNLHRELEILAQNGESSELAALFKHRDQLLSKVTDIDRAVMFWAVVRCNDRVGKLVQAGWQARPSVDVVAVRP